MIHSMDGAAINVVQSSEGKEMNWTYHHDPEGVSDYPDELPFETRIRDYWTNEAGVRIGFFGHAKSVSEFTYRKADLNFKFRAFRAPYQGSLENGDRALGPICKVDLRRERKHQVDGKSVTESRESLFDAHSLPGLMNDIQDFLLIFRDPRFPSPIVIEKVIFPFEKN
jgi:hypothetical protein